MTALRSFIYWALDLSKKDKNTESRKPIHVETELINHFLGKLG